MEAFVEATNAGVGSAVSKCVVYPLDLIKTRMATRNVGFKEAVKELHEEGDGVGGLYKGLEMKLVKSIAGKFLYFYIFSKLSALRIAQMRANGQNAATIDTLSNLVLGYFAEFFELPFIMPLEALVSRVQASAGKGASAIGIARKMYEEEGLKAFYVSLDAYLLGALQPAIQMSMFMQLRQLVLGVNVTRDLSALEAFGLGTLASSVAVTTTYPMDIIRTKQQVGAAKGNSAEGGGHLSFVEAFRKIIKDDGIAGAFKGLSAQLSQAVLSTAIMFMVKEKINIYTTRVLIALMRLLGINRAR